MGGVVRDLLTRGVRLIRVCQECGFIGDASLDDIAAAKGADCDLTDQHPPCEVEGCGYWLGFYVQDGMAMRALESSAGKLREQDLRHQWLFADGNSVRRYALSSAADAAKAKR